MLGCGPVVVPSDGDGSASEGSDTGPTSATTAPTSVTTSPTSGPRPTSTTIASDGGSDDVLDDDGPIFPDCGAAPPGTQHHCIGTPECDPPMDDVVAWVLADGGSWPDSDSGPPDTLPYVYACTIADWAEDVDLVTLRLSCVDGEHTLEIGTSVGLVFDTGGDFLLSVLFSEEWAPGSGQIVTLRRADGELVLAGAQGRQPPDGSNVPDDFLDPLAPTVIANVCEIEPPGPDGCGSVERQALRFRHDGSTADVYDRGVDQLGPYVLLVEQAVQLHDITCTDAAEHLYAWIAAPPIPD